MEGNLDLDLSANASEVLTAAKVSLKDSKCQKKNLYLVLSSMQHWHHVVMSQYYFSIRAHVMSCSVKFQMN